MPAAVSAHANNARKTPNSRQSASTRLQPVILRASSKNLALKLIGWVQHLNQTFDKMQQIFVILFLVLALFTP